MNLKKRYDLVLYNGKIDTFDPITNHAGMIAINDDQFTYIGEYDEEIKNNSISKINLNGKAVVPGFIDLHTHLWSEAEIISTDLSGIKTYEGTINKLNAIIKTRQSGEWVFASGWDESVWEDKKQFLSKVDLDRISPNNPLYIRREDGHLVVANSKALKLLPIDMDDVGVEKNEEGDPTGVLKDVWLNLVPLYKNLISENIIRSCKIAASKGITSAVDNMTIMPEGQKIIIQKYINLDLNDKLPIRVFLNPTRNLMKDFVKIGLLRNFGSSKLRVSSFKGFFDGAIGSHTALLSKEYVDGHGYGQIFLDETELISQISYAEENNCTLCIHAIGDAAIEKLLNNYEKGIKRAGKDFSTNKHRIEHAEMISETQAIRAKTLGIILSMQPNFLKWQYPGELYEQRLGKDRYQTLNRFNTLIQLGVNVCFGSDNMPLSPLYGIHQAVNFPSEEVRITPLEAIQAYTNNNAVALSMEKQIGSISVGKKADFLILSESPLEIKLSEIKNIIIEKTFVGGNCIYTRKNDA
ncbi:MAG: amidohydrolase [Candidatus Hodarchaeales archaeon]|jgi:predicted amidohydrolase YtcJ